MKRIAVYCAHSWRFSAWLTTGARPFTSPPLIAETVDLSVLKAEIVYIRLHGIDGQPYLYGDPGYITALSAEQVSKADFQDCKVFLEGCNGDEMVEAFLAAGALSVIGSDKSTWGRKYHLGPSSKIGKAWLQQVKAGTDTEKALEIALTKVPARFRHGWIATKKGAKDEKLPEN